MDRVSAELSLQNAAAPRLEVPPRFAAPRRLALSACCSLRALPLAAMALGACAPAETGRERATPSGSTPVGLAPSACSLAPAPPACGDPCADGVVVGPVIASNTLWDCPVYTLPEPVFVHAEADEPVELVIAAGTVIRGLAGDLARGRLPGALIVTRSGRIEARGTPDAPIVFTSARRVGQRAPGDWGGVVLLGSAATNVPADYLGSGNRAGEMFVEGLPPAADTTYGARRALETPDAGVPEPIEPTSPVPADAATDAASGAREPRVDPEHDCGTLRFVRIEFAGFEVGDTNELNGLTVAGCGRRTQLDYVQVHLGSDDGIELFGGNADLRHVVITGAQDDALDWDQGWTGRVQFLAIRQHGSDQALDTDNAFEGDGFADPELARGEPSHPVLSNVTVLSDSRSARALRLREGTGLELQNAILAAPGGGPLDGLIDIGDVRTADRLVARAIRIEHSIFQGAWPTRASTDSSGGSVLSEDYFALGPGAIGNAVIARDELLSLLPSAFADGGWMPVRGGPASRDFALPDEREPARPFFDTSATYRGAFAPGGEDWSLGWTAYPLR